MRFKRHHKWMLAGAMLISIVAWLAWTMLSVQSDLAR
jgi:Na+/melibiose symporter-like transporter